MAGISAIAARRTSVINKLAKLPGASIYADAPEGKKQIGLATSPVNVTGHNMLLSNTELLEFLDHVLTPLVARVEALEARKEVSKEMAIDINLNPAEIKRQALESIERAKGEKTKQAAKFAEDQLDHRARASFFAANPGASEESYKAIEVDLKRQIQLNDTLDHDRDRTRLHSIYSDI